MLFKRLFFIYACGIIVLIVLFMMKDEYSWNGKRVKVYLHSSDLVIEMDVEEYICGVLDAEMSSNFELEALKAQAVAARTYAIRKILNSKNDVLHKGGDICTDYTHCQAWNGLNSYDKQIYEAVYQTKGEVLTYNGELIEALFHSNSGGITEYASEVWGGDSLPYLVSVESFEDNSGFSEVRMSIDRVIEIFSVEGYEFSKDDILGMRILEYSLGGRVKRICVGEKFFLGTFMRSLFGLRSTNFDLIFDDGEVVFKVIGYGHGVGMSQVGANCMAKNGKCYNEILKHYYKGVEIVNYNF